MIFYRHSELTDILNSPNTLLLYPSVKAIDIHQLPKVQEQSSYTLVIIDGTWAQAKTIFNKSASIQSLKQVIGK